MTTAHMQLGLRKNIAWNIHFETLIFP